MTAAPATPPPGASGVSPATPPIEQLVGELAEGLILAGMLSEPILDATAGYRSKCVAAGFAGPAAEQMSVDYHAGLLRLMLR